MWLTFHLPAPVHVPKIVHIQGLHLARSKPRTIFFCKSYANIANLQDCCRYSSLHNPILTGRALFTYKVQKSDNTYKLTLAFKKVLQSSEELQGAYDLQGLKALQSLQKFFFAPCSEKPTIFLGEKENGEKTKENITFQKTFSNKFMRFEFEFLK